MQRGTIKQRGNFWVVRFNVKVLAPSGKTRWKSRTVRLAPIGGAYRTEASVQSLAEEAIQKEAGATVKPTSVETFERFIELTYLPAVKATLKHTTYRGYRDLFGYVQPHLGGVELRELDSVKGNAILKAVSEAKPELVHNTLVKCKRFLSSAWKHAKSVGLVHGACPIDGSVKIPEGAKSAKPHAYRPHEVGAIYNAVPDEFQAIVVVMASTGLRPEELKGLKWSDFNGDSLAIRRVVTNRKVIESTKTVASAASVPCSRDVISALKRHRKLTLGDGFIFHGRRADQPLNLENETRRKIRPALRKAKVAWHGWYAFRRGVATNLHAEGIDDKTIQGLLRHSELRTTQNIYIQHDETAARDAVNQVKVIPMKRRTA